MVSPEPADKFEALEAELAAKTSRIAELEAVVSLLEAENAWMSMAMTKGEERATDLTLRGEEDSASVRSEHGSGGHKQTGVEKLAPARTLDGDRGVILVLSDGEEGEAIDADSSKERSLEVGTTAVPIPRRQAVRVVPEEFEGSNKGEARSRCEDSSLWLEDDDVLVTPRGNKKRARVVTSDSEDEDANGGDELGSGADASPSRKRAVRGIVDSEEEDDNEGVRSPELESEDDRIPISQLFKKIRKERVTHINNNDEYSDAKGSCTPATPRRRSARLVKNQSKKGQAARRVLSFLEPKEYEASDDDTEEEGDDMDDFINDDDSSEHACGSADQPCAETELSDASAPDEELSPEPGESDGEINYADVMASIGRKRKIRDWEFEAEMLAAFDKQSELCLKAVCALYRRQTEEEQRHKATIVHNKEGFSQIDAPRASCIAEFLLDGDLYGPLKKTVQDLEAYDRYALEFCRKVASRYSKQLFAIYQNKEDPYFHP